MLCRSLCILSWRWFYRTTCIFSWCCMSCRSAERHAFPTGVACRSIERTTDVHFQSVLHVVLSIQFQLKMYIILYACRSEDACSFFLERHVFAAGHACRSIERHAVSAGFACRSTERHAFSAGYAFSVGFARRSIERHAFPGENPCRPFHRTTCFFNAGNTCHSLYRTL